MARRKYIHHESLNDRMGDNFGQINLRKSSETLSKKVSKTDEVVRFFLSVDNFSQ